MPDTKTASYLTIRFLSAIVLFFAAFSARAEFQGEYPIKITATTGMVADIAQEVTGDHAAVTSIIGSGVDPHLFKPSRSDVIKLRQADMIFYSGLLLEGQMTDILKKIGEQIPSYAVTELLKHEELITLDKHPDPHVWMDVTKWRLATRAVAEAMEKFDPGHTVDYEANARKYDEELKKLDEYVRKSIASIPENSRVMITAHDAFNYFGEAYNIEVLGIQGLSTESEAGLQDINNLVDLIVTRKIPAVFIESSVSDKNVRALIEGAASRGHEVKIGGTLFSDAMGRMGTYEGTYMGMIDHNATVITRALGGEAPAGGMSGKLANASSEGAAP